MARLAPAARFASSPLPRHDLRQQSFIADTWLAAVRSTATPPLLGFAGGGAGLSPLAWPGDVEQPYLVAADFPCGLRSGDCISPASGGRHQAAALLSFAAGGVDQLLQRHRGPGTQPRVTATRLLRPAATCSAAWAWLSARLRPASPLLFGEFLAAAPHLKYAHATPLGTTIIAAARPCGRRRGPRPWPPAAPPPRPPHGDRLRRQPARCAAPRPAQSAAVRVRVEGRTKVRFRQLLKAHSNSSHCRVRGRSGNGRR